MTAEEFVYRGDLDETALPEILATVHRHGVPGVLECRREDVTKRVFFIDGDVIFATSSDRSESLGDFLLSREKITRAQYRISNDEMDRSAGTRHGTILVQLGFIQPDELGVAVREQVEMILWDLFNWSAGQVSFRVGRFRDDEVYKIKIPTSRAIISGCKHIADGKRVIATLGGRSTVFRPLPRPPHLEDLRLEAGEDRLLEAVDGRTTLYELCEHGPFSAGLNARVLYAYAEMNLIERVDVSSAGIKIQVRSGSR